jgi:hypothetical protein
MPKIVCIMKMAGEVQMVERGITRRILTAPLLSAGICGSYLLGLRAPSFFSDGSAVPVFNPFALLLRSRSDSRWGGQSPQRLPPKEHRICKE